VRHLFATRLAYLIGHQGHDRNGLAIQGYEFNLVTLSTTMDQHDCSDVSCTQTMFWQVTTEDNPV